MKTNKEIKLEHIRSSKAKARTSKLLIQISKKTDNKELFIIGVNTGKESMRELAQRLDSEGY